jgi:hypothetical protein
MEKKDKSLQWFFPSAGPSGVVKTTERGKYETTDLAYFDAGIGFDGLQLGDEQYKRH